MFGRLLIACALLTACTKAPPGAETVGNENGDKPGVMAPPAAAATVTLTAVTFADQCGDAAPWSPPPANAPASVAPASAERRAPPKPGDAPAEMASDDIARYRCEQTSMQLAIVAKSATGVAIKSIEVLDDKGVSLGKLDASKPTRWSPTASAYEAWDQKVAAGETANVSYALNQPSFIDRYDSHDRTFTVKVTASVGGVEQKLQTSVLVVAMHAPVPT